MSEEAADLMTRLYREEAAAARALIAGRLAAGDVDWAPLAKAARGVRSAALIAGLPGAAGVALQLVDLLSASSPGPPPDERARADVLTLLDQLDPPVMAVSPPTPAVSPAAPEWESPAAVPPPPPVPPPARPAAPAPDIDASLLDLFREEVRALCGQLSTGLVALEATPTDTRRIEPLMRAAHSLKGASRIVHQMAAIDVAHEMEELLVSAQRGKLTLAQADIDVLLASTDLLATMADTDLAGWGEANAAATAGYVRTLRGRLSGHPQSPPAVTAAPPARGPTRSAPARRGSR